MTTSEIVNHLTEKYGKYGFKFTKGDFTTPGPVPTKLDIIACSKFSLDSESDEIVGVILPTICEMNNLKKHIDSIIDKNSENKDIKGTKS